MATAALLGGAKAAPALLNSVNTLAKTIFTGASQVKGTVSGKDQRRIQNKKRKNNMNVVQTKQSTPLTKNFSIRSMQPKISANQNRMNFNHSEPFFSLLSNTGFSCKTTTYNPGKSGSFSMASQFANNYTEYKNGPMQIMYVPSVDSTVKGKVYLGYSFDSNSSEPEGITEFLNLAGSVSGPVRSELVLKIPSNPGTYLTRDSLPGNGQDIQRYDSVKIFFATSGCADTGSVLGELQINHNCQFQKARINSENTQITALYALFSSDPTVAASHPFGTAYAEVIEHNGHEGVINAAGTALTLNIRGVYVVRMFATGNSSTMTSIAHGITGNSTLKYTIFAGDYGNDQFYTRIAVYYFDGTVVITPVIVSSTGDIGAFGLNIHRYMRVPVPTAMRSF